MNNLRITPFETDMVTQRGYTAAGVWTQPSEDADHCERCYEEVSERPSIITSNNILLCKPCYERTISLP